MRKLILAAAVAATLSIVAIASAAAHDDHGTGQWPTSCVDLNDIVEEHLGRLGNVGIYQRTFGDQAEAACRNDHLNDVRSVFAWAIDGGEITAPARETTPAPAPTPVPGRTPPPSAVASKRWNYIAETDPLTGKTRHQAILSQLNDLANDLVVVRCFLDRDNPFEVLVVFHNATIRGDGNNHKVDVEYRFEGGGVVTGSWSQSDTRTAVFAPPEIKVDFAYRLVTSAALYFRAFDEVTRDPYYAEFTLDGQTDPNHPVRWVLEACGMSV